MNTFEGRTAYPDSSAAIKITGEGAQMLAAKFEADGVGQNVMKLINAGVTDAAKLREAELEDLFA